MLNVARLMPMQRSVNPRIDIVIKPNTCSIPDGSRCADARKGSADEREESFFAFLFRQFFIGAGFLVCHGKHVGKQVFRRGSFF